MDMEPSSSISNNTTPSPSSSPNVESYIGSFLTVTSKSEIRYEGILYHLDPQDSTIGLKNVRSYGTEGRKTSGAQVPSSDKVYQYILFRGSDIKDLQVKTAPPAQTEEQLHHDPAIIQTNYYGEPSSSSGTGNETLTDLKVYGEPSALNTIPYPSLSPPNYSTNNVMSSNGMPPQWQGYSAAPGSITNAQQLSLASTTNMSNHVMPACVIGTSSSSPYLKASPGPNSEYLSTPSTASLSSSLPPYYNSTLMNSRGLTMTFPLTYQSTSNIEAPVVDKVDLVPKPISLLPTKSLPYSSSFVSEPIPEPFSLQQPTFLTSNQFSQPRLSEYSLSKSLYSDQIDISSNLSTTATTQGVQPPLFPLSSTATTRGVQPSLLLLSSMATTQVVQPPLLPLPPPSQKFQHSSQFTEEFDFQAMNGNFKKDEVWGNLGKANQRNNIEGLQNYGASSHDAGVINPGTVSNSEPKPAYKKDDFFDTISCNSVGRGARNGQNQSSERIKLNSETFGNFQQRPQLGYYDGYGGRHGYNRGQYHRGRGYNYRNSGRGGYMQG